MGLTCSPEPPPRPALPNTPRDALGRSKRGLGAQATPKEEDHRCSGTPTRSDRESRALPLRRGNGHSTTLCAQAPPPAGVPRRPPGRRPAPLLHSRAGPGRLAAAPERTVMRGRPAGTSSRPRPAGSTLPPMGRPGGSRPQAGTAQRAPRPAPACAATLFRELSPSRRGSGPARPSGPAGWALGTWRPGSPDRRPRRAAPAQHGLPLRARLSGAARPAQSPVADPGAPRPHPPLIPRG